MRSSLVLASPLLSPLLLAAACSGLSADPIVGGPSDAGTDGRAPGSIAIEFAPACAQGKWCWASPYPTGQDIVGLYAADRSQSLWAVDETGTIVRATTRSGVISSWETVYEPSADIVATSIVGTDDSNIWVGYGSYLGKDLDTIERSHGKLGPGGVIHWDGSTWRVHPDPDEPTTALWMAPDRKLWKGTSRTVEALDGSSARRLFTRSSSLPSPVVTVTGNRAGAVYAADRYGYASVWDGKTDGGAATFVPLVRVDDAVHTAALWVDGADTVHLGLETGTLAVNTNIASYGRSGNGNGGGWDLDGEVRSACKPANTSRPGRGKRVVHDDRGALFFAEGGTCSLGFGNRRYGANEQDVAPFGVLAAAKAQDTLSTSSGSPLWDLWVGGPGGSIGFRHVYLPEGLGPTSWRSPNSGARAPHSDLSGVSVGRDGVVWSFSYRGGTQNEVVRLDGSGAFATPISLVPSTLFAFDRRNVWIGGDRGGSKVAPVLSHFDGASWSEIALPSSVTEGTVGSIWGAAPDDIWATVSTTRALQTAAAVIVHFDGKTWTVAETFDGVHRAMGGSASNNVWFASSRDKVGGVNRITRWNGASMLDRSEGFPPDRSIEALVPVSAEEAWALAPGGSWGSIPYHFVDGRWRAVTVPNVESTGIGIRAMAVRNGGDVWFGGFRGMRPSAGETLQERSAFMRWDGHALTTKVDPAIGRMITAMATGPDGRIWAVGRGGTMVFAVP
ncbi:hypothetical protein [Pendulispora albinea]|uniref:Uncharacterized protein n=1 Tax=Pendulispora albinea TaxID=2741071 RepID=A0ABZ2M2A2_9BACT